MKRNARVIAICVLCVGGRVAAQEATAFGTLENPVPVESVDASYSYLRILRTPDGGRLTAVRVGSISDKEGDRTLDRWELSSDQEEKWTVHIDPNAKKTEASPNQAPPGLMTVAQLTARELTRRGKSQYINVAQPTGSSFLPLSATHDGKLVVARVVSVDNGRDIEVLIESERGWSPLGERGSGLTGLKNGKSPFLTHLENGPNGDLYAGISHTFPSRYYLYRFDGTRWHELGPDGGEQAAVARVVDGGLFWLQESSAPSRLIVRKGSEGATVVTFREGQWKLEPVSEPLKAYTANQPIWNGLTTNAASAWVIWISEESDDLMAICLSGVSNDDLRGPFLLESFPDGAHLEQSAVSSDGEIAVIVSGKIWQFRIDQDKAVTHVLGATEVPPSSDWDLAWSPSGFLHAARRLSPSGVELSRQNSTGSPLEVLAATSPDFEIPIQFSPQISFDSSGRPIVLWADFFP